MKTLSNLGLFTLTWILTNLSLSIAFLISEPCSIENAIYGIVYFTFISLIFSLPAFIFFLVSSTLIIETKWSNRKKRWAILFANYTDIILTFLVLAVGVLFDSKPTNKAVFELVQNSVPYLLVLLVSSTIIILVMPFHFQTSIKSIQHENN